MAKNPRYQRDKHGEQRLSSLLARVAVHDIYEDGKVHDHLEQMVGGARPTRQRGEFKAAAKKGAAGGQVKTQEQLDQESAARAAMVVEAHKKQYGDPAMRITLQQG